MIQTINAMMTDMRKIVLRVCQGLSTYGSLLMLVALHDPFLHAAGLDEEAEGPALIVETEIFTSPISVSLAPRDLLDSR